MLDFLNENRVNVDFHLEVGFDFNCLVVENLVRRLVFYIFNIFSIESGQVNFLFCENYYMQNLNFKFLSKNYPTDVLSFPSSSFFDNKGFLGDVAISVDKAKSQAIYFKHSFLEEILLLSIHGVLHLMGYDHELGFKQEKEMFRLEKKIFLEVRDFIL